MIELSWPKAYRKLAEMLAIFHKQYDKVAGPVLFKICSDDPAAKQLFQFITRFKQQSANNSLDPVNLFASINSLHSPHGLRVARYNFYLELLSINAKQEFEQVNISGFEGCPTPRTSNIITPRSIEQDQQLWRQFADVIELGVKGINETTFRNIIQWKGLQIAAFTMFLFWIDSDNFISLDNNMVSFLRNKGYLKSRLVTYQTYIDLLKKTKGLDYVALSQEAYTVKNPELLPDNISLKKAPNNLSNLEINPEIVSPENPVPNLDGVSFQRNVISRDGEFKMVAIKVYDDTLERWRRVIEPNKLYKFSQAYDFSNPNFITYIPEKDLRLYNLKNMSISVSALVGKNGSGKSSIVDLIYVILNNISEQHPRITEEMEYVNGIFLDFYYAAEDLYGIEIRNRKVRIKRFKSVVGGYEFEEEIKVANFNLEDLFYTVSLNYSHFGLNSRHIGEWINSLFHKNDAYQQPLVLNPHRNEGNIDVNEEEAFANARLLSNILFYDNTVDAKDKISLFRKITERQKVESIELSIDSEKLKYLYSINAPTEKQPNRKINGLWEIADRYWSDFVKNVNIIFDLPKYHVASPEHAKSLTGNAYKYILKKAIGISLKYRKKYGNEYNTKSHTFKDMFGYLTLLKNDTSHITFKFKQAINFIKYDHLRQFLPQKISYKRTYSISVEQLSIQMFNTISDNSEDKLRTINLIPPSFLKAEIVLSKNVKLSGLSSGEKQRIFAASTIGYHLLNIDSGNNDYEMVSYKFVNIIFDEIELYYHPEMQRTFVSYLLKYISYLPLELAGINITFITHSPFILSDIPSSNIAYLGGERSAWDTFGANIHDMLSDSFFLSKGVMGEYVKETILSLNAFLSGNESIGEFTWTRESSWEVINIIGEPLIKKQLSAIWIEKYKEEDLDMRIAKIKSELKMLQDEKNRE